MYLERGGFECPGYHKINPKIRRRRVEIAVLFHGLWRAVSPVNLRLSTAGFNSFRYFFRTVRRTAKWMSEELRQSRSVQRYKLKRPETIAQTRLLFSTTFCNSSPLVSNNKHFKTRFLVLRKVVRNSWPLFYETFSFPSVVIQRNKYWNNTFDCGIRLQIVLFYVYNSSKRLCPRKMNYNQN